MNIIDCIMIVLLIVLVPCTYWPGQVYDPTCAVGHLTADDSGSAPQCTADTKSAAVRCCTVEPNTDTNGTFQQLAPAGYCEGARWPANMRTGTTTPQGCMEQCRSSFPQSKSFFVGTGTSHWVMVGNIAYRTLVPPPYNSLHCVQDPSASSL